MKRWLLLVSRVKVYGIFSILILTRKLQNKMHVLRLSKVKLRVKKLFLREELSPFLRTLYYVYESHVEGEIVEFGTQTGKSSVEILAFVEIMNVENSYLHKEKYKSIHFLDSFAGFPEITSQHDKKSHHVQNRIWKKGGCVGLDVNTFEKLMKRFSKETAIYTYPGYFVNTLTTLHVKKFCWVHLDVDLYQSSIEVLDYLFANSMISNGAVIILADYYANRSDPYTGQQLAWSEITKKYKVTAASLGYVGSMSTAVIVQEYSN